ncbi:unnamed protein product [Arctogadus glacialis]
MTFSDIERVTTKLNLIHIVNMDEPYDECSTAKPILKWLKEDAEDEWKSKGVAARIFSRMANKWSDCRNRCSTELMRRLLYSYHRGAVGVPLPGGGSSRTHDTLEMNGWLPQRNSPSAGLACHRHSIYLVFT